VNMPMLTRRALCAGTVAIFALSVAGAARAEDVLQAVKARGELIVGTEMQYAPYDFLKDGKQAGFNSELFAEIGKEMNVKVTFLDLPWPSVLPGLEAGKFDIVAGPVSITKNAATATALLLPSAKAPSTC
jgi:polar amino acid transport system substrate-binding protein